MLAYDKIVVIDRERDDIAAHRNPAAGTGGALV
jgi:hypothetical protein